MQNGKDQENQTNSVSEPVKNPNPAANENLPPADDSQAEAGNEEDINSEITDGEGG